MSQNNICQEAIIALLCFGFKGTTAGEIIQNNFSN